MESALQVFNLLLQIGAGTGLLFILRWFWWRINSYSEITAMVVSFLIALYFFIQRNYDNTKIAELIEKGIDANTASAIVTPFKGWQELVIGVAITTVCWIAVTFLTKPADQNTLIGFYNLVKPFGRGWKKVVEKAKLDGEKIETAKIKNNLPLGILCMVVGCLGVYSALFATGYWIYSNYIAASILSVVTILSSVFLLKTWKKVTD